MRLMRQHSRPRRRIGGAVALCMAGALAACMPPPDTTSTGPNGPGVGTDSVKVGYVAVDIGAVANSLGFLNVEDGGYPNVSKGIQAVVDWVNANGGLGGRRLDATIKPYEASQDSPEYAESVCKSFTQDIGVFAMLFDGQFQNNARPCYRAANTLMLDQTLVAHDTAEFESFAPYLWSASNPEIGTFARAQLEVLKSAGWFNGTRGVAVVYPDTEVTRRVAGGVVRSFLAENQIGNVREFAIDSSNIGTLGNSVQAALTGATAAGVDRVYVVGGSRILAVMLSAAEANDLEAKYSMSTFDSPAFFVDNSATIVNQRLEGMAGLGFQGGGDARLGSGDTPFPDPTNPTEVLCKQIIDGAGAAPPAQNRENYRVVFQHCDTTLLLKAAFDKMPKESINATSFRDAVWSLGDTWRSSLNYGGGWQPGSYAGASVGRGMVWDTACQLPERPPGCFRYGTPPQPLLAAAGVQGTTPVAPTTP